MSHNRLWWLVVINKAVMLVGIFEFYIEMTKRFFKIFLPVAVAGVALVGCDNPSYPDPEGERGTLTFSDFTVTAVDTTIIQGETISIDVADFVVRVRNSNSGDVVASWPYSEVPSEVELLDGTYLVEAYNAEVESAAWDAPYYYASTQVRVYGGEYVAVSALQCRLSNVKVSVSYSDAFKAAMDDDVRVSVSLAQGAVLDFTPVEDRSGYFEYVDGATTLVATLTGTVDGVETMRYQVFTGVTAGQHCRVLFSLD